LEVPLEDLVLSQGVGLAFPDELTVVEDPAWPHLAELITGSPVDVQVLPG
jgi:hypothetical protein